MYILCNTWVIYSNSPRHKCTCIKECFQERIILDWSDANNLDFNRMSALTPVWYPVRLSSNWIIMSFLGFKFDVTPNPGIVKKMSNSSAFV